MSVCVCERERERENESRTNRPAIYHTKTQSIKRE